MEYPQHCIFLISLYLTHPFECLSCIWITPIPSVTVNKNKEVFSDTECTVRAAAFAVSAWCFFWKSVIWLSDLEDSKYCMHCLNANLGWKSHNDYFVHNKNHDCWFILYTTDFLTFGNILHLLKKKQTKWLIIQFEIWKKYSNLG